MSFSARYMPAILVAILSVSSSLFAQTTPKPAPKVPRGSLSGRVTVRDKGLAGAAVGVRKGEVGGSTEPFQRTFTDQDGFYHFNKLPPGTYSVTVSTPAFVLTSRSDSIFKTVLIGEDENVDGINFALVRGGVITGRVTDADGHAVIAQQVQVFPVIALEQRAMERGMYPAGNTLTDDRGVYRIFGLRAGRYKVSAGRSDDDQGASYNQTRNISYRQVFHPDVSDASKATVIEVSEGSEATNVDIALSRAMQMFSASGVALDSETGLPVAGMRVGVQRSLGQRFEPVNTSAISNSRGEFTVEGLIPGKYFAHVYPNQAGELRAEPLSFEIKDQDLTTLTVRLGKGASVSGVLVLDTSDRTAFEKLLQLQLRGYSMTPTPGMALGSSAISPIGVDGSFRLAGLGGGRLNLLLATPSSPIMPKGFAVVRVEREGVVLPRGLELKDGEQLTGVRVIVAYGSAVIRGVVKVENGSVPENARFFVRLGRPGEAAPAFRPPTVDERGHFLMEGLPAGTYDITATVSGPFPARFARQSITVADGATLDLTLTIDMNAPPKQ